jgi:hypothetical protein
MTEANGKGQAKVSIAEVKGPGYWMNEQSGFLAPVVEAYIQGEPMTLRDIGIMRAYLRQWIQAPVWNGGEAIEELRRGIDEIISRAGIESWLERALDVGIDPL